MRKHQRFLADVSVIIVTGAVKLLITRRDDQSSKLLRVRSPDYSLSGGRNWAAIQPPLKRMTRPCARVLCSRLSPWAMRLTLWEPGRPGRADVAPPRPFRRSQLCPVLASATAPAISGALSTRPNVDGVAGRIQRSELLHRVTPCGPE